MAECRNQEIALIRYNTNENNDTRITIFNEPPIGDLPDKKIVAPPEVIGDIQKYITEAKFKSKKKTENKTKKLANKQNDGGEPSTQPQSQSNAETEEEMIESWRTRHFSNRWFKKATSDGTNFFPNVAEAFATQEVRNKFLQRVFIILALHIAVCIIFNFVALYVEEIYHFMKIECDLVFVALGIFLLNFFLLSCISGIGRFFPINLMTLIITTGCLAYMSAFITIYFNTHIFVISLITTFIIYVHIVVLSSHEQFNIMKCTSILMLFIIFLLLFALLMSTVALFVENVELVNLSYAIMITVTFTMFLVYDAKKIMDGNRLDLDTDEYLYAVLSLYLNAGFTAMWLFMKVQQKRRRK